MAEATTEAAVDRARGVAQFARRLSAAATTADVARVVTDFGSTVLGARHTALALCIDDGGDPGEVRTVQPRDLEPHLRERYLKVHRSDPIPICDAIRTSATVSVASRAEVAERYPNLVADWVTAGVTATAASPLLDLEGRAFGAISAGWDRPEPPDADAISQLETIAELCARCIERTRLTDARLADSEQARALADLAAELASARSPVQVGQAIAVHVPGVIGASSASFAIVDAPHRLLHVIDPPGEDGWLVRGDDHQPLDGPLPRAIAARTGQAVVLATPAELAAALPDGAAHARRQGIEAAVALPVADSRGRTIGVLGLAWPTPIVAGTTVASVTKTVIGLCRQTLERAQLHDAEHTLVEALQASVLRPLPKVAGVEAAAAYLPAGSAVGIGGDFFGGVALDDHRLGVVLGDVAGHGVAAAADMARFQSLLTAFLATETPLGQLFDRVQRALGREDAATIASAVVVIVDTAADTLRFVSAGHPPLLLRDPDGSVSTLVGGRRPVLGVEAPSAEPVTVAFGPGSVLLGYTDGLVERRTEDLAEAIAGLARTFAGTPVTDPALLLDVVVAAHAGSGAHHGRHEAADDIAVVVLSRSLGPASVPSG